MYIHVKVSPKSKKELIVEKKKNHFVISVKEKAERNMANDRVLELLAAYYKISIKKVRIINGHQSRSKLLDVGIE